MNSECNNNRILIIIELLCSLIQSAILTLHTRGGGKSTPTAITTKIRYERSHNLYSLKNFPRLLQVVVVLFLITIKIAMENFVLGNICFWSLFWLANSKNKTHFASIRALMLSLEIPSRSANLKKGSACLGAMC